MVILFFLNKKNPLKLYITIEIFLIIRNMTKKFDSLKNEMQLMIDSEPKLKA